MLLMRSNATQLDQRSGENAALDKNLDNYIQMQLEGKLDISAEASSEQKASSKSDLQLESEME